MANRTLFPATAMACPESHCHTPVFTRYEGLVNHWKTIHNLYMDFYNCQLCGRRYKRRTDANGHLRQVPNSAIIVNRVQDKDYIQPELRSPDASCGDLHPIIFRSFFTCRSSLGTHRGPGRQAADKGGGGERSSNVMTNKDIDSVFPEDRFTLM